MRTLFWGNSPWTLTGYGRQTKEISARLQDLGHEVAILGLAGLLGSAIDWRGITIYPARRDPLGADVVGHYARHFGADIVISLYDIWALPKDVCRSLPCPWVALIPVDGTPVNEHMLARIRTADYPVAFSAFGKYELWEAGIEATYIPLGIDTGVFKPGDKREARERLGISEDIWLVTMVAANKGYPPRKAWPESLMAFAEFHSKHPEAVLYVHSTRMPYGSEDGVYLEGLAQALKINGAVTYADEGEVAVGVPDEQMADIYRASDVLLNPAMGEGFCLPVAEAQACGCPVITQDCSAMSELTANGIAARSVQPLWVPQLGYWWQLPSVAGIRAALEEVHGWPVAERQRYAEQGVSFIRDNYSWPHVMLKYWLPFLERVEAELW